MATKKLFRKITKVYFLEKLKTPNEHSMASDEKKDNLKLLKYQAQGRIQDLVRGGAKLTQWRRMGRLSSRTRIYGSTLLHNFFL